MVLKMAKLNFKKTSNIIFENSKSKFFIFTMLGVLIFVFSYNIGIFWDNILFVSKTGNYLYNNNIFNWNIPNSLDAGHPPFLGFLLAIFWKIFGHKLWVSHLLMIPFTIGLLYQIFRLAFFYTKSYFLSILSFILILSDPTLITQLILVNPEILLLFFFFLAINSILNNNYYLKVFALFFLSIISLRSMMLCGGIFIFEVLNLLYINKKKIKSIFTVKFFVGYLIASLPALSYLIIHYINKGWLISHPNSPWAGHRNMASIEDVFRNIIVLIHRYSDFGRFFIYIFIFFSILKFRKIIFVKNIKQLFLIAFLPVFIIVFTSIFSTNPFGHRYFLTSFILLNFLSFYILTNLYKHKKIIYILMLSFLISGNLWIYPRNIAQGWDSSLAHLPYHNLRKEAIHYLDKNNIKVQKVGTFFPNSTTIDNIDFNNDYRLFKHFNGENEYILFSNVYNLTDKEYNSIDNKYILIKSFSKNNIYVNLYKLK